MSGNCHPGDDQAGGLQQRRLRFDLQKKLTKKVTKLMSVSMIRLPLWEDLSQIEHQSHKHTKKADYSPSHVFQPYYQFYSEISPSARWSEVHGKQFLPSLPFGQTSTEAIVICSPV